MAQQSDRPEYPIVANNLINLANAYCAQGDPEKAVPLYNQALKIREKAMGVDHPAAVLPFLAMARCYSRQGRFTEAEAMYKRTIQILGRPGAQTERSLVSVLQQYSILLRRMNREIEAQQMEARAEMIRARSAQPNPAR